MQLEIDEQEFIDHVARICSKNLRTPCAICIKCPFKKHALQAMKQKGWKMPNKEASEKLEV